MSTYRNTFTQTPREVRHRRVGYECWLDEEETLLSASVAITPPPSSPVRQDYLPPAFDQRMEALDTGSWLFDGVQTECPLFAREAGVAMDAMAPQYLMLVRNDEILRPYVDYEVIANHVAFFDAPEPGDVIWGTLQNPIFAGEQRDVLLDPPYSAFDVQAYLIAPENTKVLLVSRGGSASLTYKVKLRVQTSLGKEREIRLDYRVVEP